MTADRPADRTLGRAPPGGQTAECHDEGRNLELGDGEPLDRESGARATAIAASAPSRAPPTARVRQFPTSVQLLPLATAAETTSGEAEHRADREVNAAGEDDEGHAHGQDAVDEFCGGGTRSSLGGEGRLLNREDDGQDDEEDHRREPAEHLDGIDAAVVCRSTGAGPVTAPVSVAMLPP